MIGKIYQSWPRELLNGLVMSFSKSKSGVQHDLPDYGLGTEVPGLIPCCISEPPVLFRKSASLRLKVGDRVFMSHLRGGIFAKIVVVEEGNRILGRVVAMKGLIRGIFIDEIIRVPPDCIEKVLPA